MSKVRFLILLFSLNLFSFSGMAHVTKDIGQTLSSILDREKVKGACQRYWKKKNSIDEILCGKSIFFNLEIKTDLGIPQGLLSQIREAFSKQFEKIGLYDDPDDKKQKLGLVELKSLYPTQAKDLLSFKGIRQVSCAGCHVGQMPDGRWSVGYPNYRFNAGALNILFTFSLWLADKNKDDEAVWLPSLVTKFREMQKVIAKKPLKYWMLTSSRLAAFAKLSPQFFKFIKQDPPSLGDQRSYLNSAPGTYNAASPIISFGDREFFTTPPQIWDLDHKDVHDEAYLGTITSVYTLEAFIKHAYAYTSLSSKYSTDKYVRPLASYLRSLKTPSYLGQIDNKKVERGREYFKKNCISCHDGRNGASKHRHPIATVGSPKEIDSIFLDYSNQTRQSRQLMQALQESHPFEPITYGIKARRLNGIWSKKRLMTNGSIEGLDHLLCLNGQKRKIVNKTALSELIHMDLCAESLETREYLKEFLLQF